MELLDTRFAVLCLPAAAVHGPLVPLRVAELTTSPFNHEKKRRQRPCGEIVGFIGFDGSRCRGNERPETSGNFVETTGFFVLCPAITDNRSPECGNSGDWCIRPATTLCNRR
jgi:hypothetical protein